MGRFLSRTEIAVVLLYLFSGLVHTTSEPGALDGLAHLRIGPLVLAPPLVLSGDSPHYLVSVNSLIEDGDFDLANITTISRRSLEIGIVGPVSGEFRSTTTQIEIGSTESGGHIPLSLPCC